jgi:hypothetical protein
VDNAELSDAERAYLEVNRGWDTTERGYSAIQSTKPQTVGYGLNDSPAGLAAYLGEKWHSWSDVTPTDDFLCATFTLYWITQSITSSMRDYWDNRWHPVDPAYVSTPTAVWCLRAPDRSRGRTAALVFGALIQHSTLDSFSERRTLCPRRRASGGRRGPDRLLQCLKLRPGCQSEISSGDFIRGVS